MGYTPIQTTAISERVLSTHNEFVEGVGREITSLQRAYQFISKTYTMEHSSIEECYSFAMMVRDVHGAGYRDAGRWLYQALLIVDPMGTLSYIDRYLTVGRWDDLLCLFPNAMDTGTIYHYICEHIRNLQAIPTYRNNSHLAELTLENIRRTQNAIANFYASQLITDTWNMANGYPVSLAGKWAPTEKRKGSRELAAALKVSMREYRKKYLSPLRKAMRLPERLLALKTPLVYDSMTLTSIFRYINHILTHDSVRFKKWLADAIREARNSSPKKKISFKAYEDIVEIVECGPCSACEFFGEGVMDKSRINGYGTLCMGPSTGRLRYVCCIHTNSVIKDLVVLMGISVVE